MTSKTAAGAANCCMNGVVREANGHLLCKRVEKLEIQPVPIRSQLRFTDKKPAALRVE